jgi:hypothetical protein
VHALAQVTQPFAAVGLRPGRDEPVSTSRSGALASKAVLKSTSVVISVPALLTSMPGVTRNKRVLRSFFSGTMPRSRKNSATTGAGTPQSRYSPVSGWKPGVTRVSLFGSVIA